MKSRTLTFAALALLSTPAFAQRLGATWGTGAREGEYYRIVDLGIPKDLGIEAGSLCQLPDGRLAVGTRRGDIYLVDGAYTKVPRVKLHRYARGLDEILGLGYRDGAFYATQQTEVTRITDKNGDGRADTFENLSDVWGFEHYHEFAFGSPVDAEGNIWVALGLSSSYHYRAKFRGWAFKITPDGKSIPIASGIRSAGAVAPNEHGVMFYAESQGPWNGSCSLKHLRPGGFMGHPISFDAYKFAPEMGPRPLEPKSGSRLRIEADRIPQLVPYSVVFPYRKMGQSISAFRVDRTGGKFGPFENQIFIGDYSLSIVMRATTEKVNGTWQGACYPFREGLSTGILAVEFSPEGYLVAGGTNRGWPVRGNRHYVLERLEWTGVMPFEIEKVSIRPEGFHIDFTLPVDRAVAADPANYKMLAYTHVFQKHYGSPEVDKSTPTVTDARVANDRMSVDITVDGMVRGHVHEFDLGALRSAKGKPLLHKHAYYTANEIPGRTRSKTPHPVPEDERWLTYPGGEGPGNGKHIVLISAEQEYRSEQSLPMLARILSKRHGFHCTVLFGLNKDGLVDPTQKIRWQDKTVMHDIPGLEHLTSADLLILQSRLVTLPDEQIKHVIDYIDSGKPILGIRTANHGFLQNFPYKLNGKRVRFGDDVLGGAFRGHHGNWHRDSTRGIAVDSQKQHPILRGVTDVWGPSDVYRTYPEGKDLPKGCTALMFGQPLTGRSHDDPPNKKKIPLPIAWTKTWTGSKGVPARVFHVTMGSARDMQSAGLRRMTINAAYWCLGLEERIDAQSSVDYVGPYEPLESGFNYPKLGVVPRPVSYYR